MRQSRLLLCVAHLLGNALLLLLGYYWLGLGESDATRLALSAAVVLFFGLAAVWLHGTALVMFRREEKFSFVSAARRALHYLFPMFLLSLVVLLIYIALWRFYYSFGHEAFTIGSYGTMRLRRPVAPANVLKAFHGLIWFIRWIVIPALGFPLASEVAYHGWSGFSISAFRRSKNILFWVEAGLFTVAAIYLPLHLFFWVPSMPNFSMEVVSVAARIGVGYLLFTGGLLAVEFFTSAGSPLVTQVSTAASP